MAVADDLMCAQMNPTAACVPSFLGELRHFKHAPGESRGLVCPTLRRCDEGPRSDSVPRNAPDMKIITLALLIPRPTSDLAGLSRLFPACSKQMRRLPEQTAAHPVILREDYTLHDFARQYSRRGCLRK